jgi:predicted metal-dependent HD superfamily phosphohydrolase
VDLSILGQDGKRFSEYERQIRQEYSWVPEAVFAAKRAEVLERFLARQWIFATEWFREKYEEQARQNLKGSISRLRGFSR